MENTIDNHKLFRAHYLGQKVLKSENGVYTQTLFTRHLLNQSLIDGTYLELTPLSMISDEDAIQVAHLFNWISKADKENVKIKATKKYLIYFNEEEITFQDSEKISSSLRSKGYALPYNGVSVEQQIEYGWIKLKTNE
jgi:hypothetical protein